MRNASGSWKGSGLEKLRFGVIHKKLKNWGQIFILDFAIAKGMASGRIGGQIFIKSPVEYRSALLGG